MPPPFVPQFTGDADPKTDIVTIISYLYDLDSFLNEGDVDGTWSTTGVTTNRALTVGDTLADTQHVLGTLIQLLQNKGIL